MVEDLLREANDKANVDTVTEHPTGTNEPATSTGLTSTGDPLKPNRKLNSCKRQPVFSLGPFRGVGTPWLWLNVVRYPLVTKYSSCLYVHAGQAFVAASSTCRL